MTATESVMRFICRGQHSAYILLGFYLTDGQFADIRGYLTQEPFQGVQRYLFRGVPVYRATERPGKGTSIVHGVRFDYFDEDSRFVDRLEEDYLRYQAMLSWAEGMGNADLP